MRLKLYRNNGAGREIADFLEIECVTFAYMAETNTLTVFLIIDRKLVTEIYENIFSLSPIVDVEDI